MASTTIKSTYSLDVETVRSLERMARRWKVSKSEALRRAIRTVAEQNSPPEGDATAALDALQRSIDLSADAARRWGGQVRAERRASPRRSRR